MNEVSVKKKELLTTIQANRATHRQEFEAALEGYRTHVVAELERTLMEARRGQTIRGVSFTVPSDHTDDYDRAIRMLEMSVDEEIEISQHDFAQYVMDDWSWKRDFLTTNSLYTAN